jgi:hypothetical protein
MNKKVDIFINKDERVCVWSKRSPNIFIMLKNDLFGCFRIEKNATMPMQQV